MTTQLKEALKNLARAKKISLQEILKIAENISDPWQEARGILRHKKISGLKYQKRVRKEWSQR